MDDDAFLHAIEAAPADETLRLVYADWLEDHGDRRAEFLRAAVALRSPATGEDQRRELAKRLWVLREGLAAAWVVRVYRSVAEDDVHEAVIRELLGKKSKGHGSFLEIRHRGDPSQYLLAGVVSRFPEVRPASHADVRTDGVFDPQTGERAHLLQINILEWTAADRCRVLGGFFFDGLGARFYEFTVGIKDDGWTVLGSSLAWIS
jgi:uncharacterized protein (TIGR02996 family)